MSNSNENKLSGRHICSAPSPAMHCTFENKQIRECITYANPHYYEMSVGLVEGACAWGSFRTCMRFIARRHTGELSGDTPGWVSPASLHNFLQWIHEGISIMFQRYAVGGQGWAGVAKVLSLKDLLFTRRGCAFDCLSLSMCAHLPYMYTYINRRLATGKSCRFVCACARSGCWVELNLQYVVGTFSLFPFVLAEISRFPLAAGCSPFSPCEIEVKVESKWNRSDTEVISKWNQSDIEVKVKWCRSEVEKTSKWHRSDIVLKSTWTRSEVQVTSKWHRSELEVSSKWPRSQLNVSSKWNRRNFEVKSMLDRSEGELALSEFKVSSKWNRIDPPPNLLSKFSWPYRQYTFRNICKYVYIYIYIYMCRYTSKVYSAFVTCICVTDVLRCICVWFLCWMFFI